MGKIIITAIFSLTGLVCTMQGAWAEATCHKCEVIREANKHKVNQYEYYEDYTKANPQENGKQDPQNERAAQRKPVTKTKPAE